MTQLTRFACGAGLLASAFSVCATTHPHSSTTGQHWGVGIQAAVLKSTVNSQAHLTDFSDGSIDTRVTGNATTSLFGISLGRYWSDGATTWGLQLEANQGVGDVFLMHQIQDETGLNDAPTQINTTIKPKQQYNLLLLWKHALTADFSFLAGFGASAMNTETHIGFYDGLDYNFVSEYNRVNPGESRYAFGPVFTFGFEHNLSKHSAVDFTLRYTTYGSAHLTDFNNFSIWNTSLNTENNFESRKFNLDQLALSASYHYYF